MAELDHNGLLVNLQRNHTAQLKFIYFSFIR